MRTFPLFLAATFLAAALPAAAQDAAPPAGEQDIVVTGRVEAREEQIREFVDAFTRKPGQDQLSRFEFAICPATYGIGAEASQSVVARLRRIAKALDIPVGKPNCTPNVLVMVTADKKVLIETIEKKYSQLLGEMPARKVREMANAPGSAAAWQVQGPPLDADGAEITEGGASGVRVNRTFRQTSRMTPAARPQLLGAVVIVEQEALIGMTATQLADYAAMRTLAATDPARLPAGAPQTILTILDAPDSAEVPLSMTQWDVAFLKALYAAPTGLYAGAERSAIRKQMEKALQSGEEAEQ
jgi:hypothetical protein